MDGEIISCEQLGSIVSRHARVHSGGLVFAGTPVPVATLIDYLNGGHSIEDFLEGFPSVERWQGRRFSTPLPTRWIRRYLLYVDEPVS